MGENLNPTNMYSQVELIHPARAKALLAGQINPRKPDAKRVQRYANARRSGDWVLHHQGIALDCRGRLRDGQHRLLMVVATDLPTPFYVTYNLPEEACLHLDEQLPRSVAVALRAAGKGDFSNGMIAVASAIETLPAHAMERYTKDEMMRLLTTHAEALAFVEENFVKAMLLPAPARCVVARGYYHGERGRLLEFCEVVKSGITVSSRAEEDVSAIRFRNLLIEMRGQGGHSPNVERYRKGQNALEAFLARTPIQKLYATERDLFPLPGTAC